jgi:hypothetical protein
MGAFIDFQTHQRSFSGVVIMALPDIAVWPIKYSLLEDDNAPRDTNNSLTTSSSDTTTKS